MQRVLALAAVAAVGGVLLGLVFAGSTDRIAAGVRIAGVNVGGLTAAAAKAKLEARAHAVSGVPVIFTAGAKTWRLRPTNLGVQVDWGAAVKLALRQGDGLGPFRGLRRIGVRVFGADVSPPTRVWKRALDYELGRMSRVVRRPHRDASLALRGVHPVVLAGSTGHVLDRNAAAQTIVGALAGFSRTRVALPVRVDPPTVSTMELAPALAQTRTALSRPIRMSLGRASWWLPQRKLASMLALPHGGSRALGIGGPGADRYFTRLHGEIDHPARDATFRVFESGRVAVVPARPGRVIDARTTESSILAAALSPPGRRMARVVVSPQQARRSTAEARAMGITTRVSRYETIYGGEPNRIHNVQLVARLLDGKLIAPGATFSFNRTTGARTASKGFLEAPVIINGEVTTGLGGGVCQVSTTVFNTAYEAGLRITARTNHALYISHYPQGRDATVDYPDVDLRFVNDTPRWLLLRTFVGSSSLVVDLYGAPLHRRVVSEERPLVDTGPPPTKRIRDRSLYKGVTVVEQSGEPSRSTSVRRLVYANGKLLYDNTWYSSYRGEPRVVRVGTKPKLKPKKKIGPSGPSGPSGPTGPAGIKPPP